MSRPTQRGRGELVVVSQDELGAVVFKPAGLSSERPSRAGHAEPDSLIVRARSQLGWPESRLPHRLDRPTRGLVMISRDARSAAMHAEEIRAGAWTKWYVARIPSVPQARAAAPFASADGLVGPHRVYLRRAGERAEVVRSGGDPSRLTVLAVARATDRPGESHALILLETGRFHQIRAMLASLGFPLVGDLPYGGIASGGRPRSGAPPVRGEPGEGKIDIDLEAIALRVARGGETRAHRLERHPDRVGVAESIEAALDAAISGA